MARISFAKDAATALKGAGSALIIGAADALSAKKRPALFTPKVQRLLTTLIGDTKPGPNGAVSSTLTGAAPERLIVGVLPKAGSRYLAPSRPDAWHKILAGSGLAGTDKKAAIIMVLADPEHLRPALGALARAFPQYSMKSGAKSPRLSLIVVQPEGTPIKVTPADREYLKAVQEAARLVDSPPTDMNPEGLEAAAKAFLQGAARVKVSVLTGQQLVNKGLGGIYGVGKAALSAPRMLVATYRPASASGTHVALVGKGVTFDTGGLHLKPRGGMETMKCDMGGSAAVLGAFYALVKSKTCKHTVSLVMCMAENAIGPGSFKPDDILTMHSGLTVEVNNTDAEGRLLLGDGVSWSARVLKADVVIDAATLTGAQMVATGANHAAVVSNDAELEALAVQAGLQSGDLVHPLPFAPEFYKDEFKSGIADMKNSVKNRMNAQSSCAAQFVYNHIASTSVRWLHVDLAGPSFRGGRGTGYGVGLLSNLVGRL